MRKKLFWRSVKALEGWACSSCGWVYVNPSLGSRDVPRKNHVQKSFDAHVCKKFPRASKRLPH